MAGVLSSHGFKHLIKTLFLFLVMSYNDAQQNKGVAVRVMFYGTNNKFVLYLSKALLAAGSKHERD